MTDFVIPTRSPKPSPTAFTGHYGFLVAGPTGYVVRSESSETPLGTIDLAVGGAVSPDGRLFAGWTRTTPADLRIGGVLARGLEEDLPLLLRREPRRASLSFGHWSSLPGFYHPDRGGCQGRP